MYRRVDGYRIDVGVKGADVPAAGKPARPANGSGGLDLVRAGVQRLDGDAVSGAGDEPPFEVGALQDLLNKAQPGLAGGGLEILCQRGFGFRHVISPATCSASLASNPRPLP